MGVVSQVYSLGNIAGVLVLGYSEKYYASFPAPFDHRASPYAVLVVCMVVCSILSVSLWWSTSRLGASCIPAEQHSSLHSKLVADVACGDKLDETTDHTSFKKCKLDDSERMV